MDNFKVIYKILKYLETAMDFAEPDYEPIKATALGLSEERWMQLIRMLVDSGYIEGVKVMCYTRGLALNPFEPKITLKGLEYLAENSIMQKIFRTMKGIKDITPSI